MFAQDRNYYHGNFYGVTNGTIKKQNYFHKFFQETYPREQKYIIEFTYYLDGSDEILIDGKTIFTHKDSLLITPRQTLIQQNIVCRTLEDISYIEAQFYTKNTFISNLTTIDVSVNPKIKEMFIQLNKIWERKQPNYVIRASALFFAILEELSIMTESKSVSRLDKAVEYIHKHYIESDFSCKVLPELCGLKHSQFIDLFRKELHTTPSKYLTGLRLDRAAEFLIQSDLDVQDIAKQVGYDNPWYFAKTFKNRFGVSPSKYKIQ